MGAGQTLLQTAVNPYVVRLGPEESAAVRISIMGILNKGAGVISPLVFTALILSNFTDTVGTELSQQQVDDMANGLILPYLGMALFIGLLAFAVKKSPLPELITDDAEQTRGSSEISETLSHPNLVFGAIAIFLYVAVEVIAGDTIGTFALSLGVANYSVMTSYTMIFMVFGYILGILLIPKFITQQTALTLSAVLGIAITLCILLIDAQSFMIANTLLIPLGLSLIHISEPTRPY